MSDKRPNILLITSDQQRADCFGFEGRNIKTPHLDQLAKEGTHFSAAITPCPLCQPARASILTGQLPLTHGVYDNKVRLDPEVGEKGVAGQLSDAGYDTHLVGKGHFDNFFNKEPSGGAECVKTQATMPDDWNGPYMGFDTVDMVTIGHNYFLPPEPPSGLQYEKFFYADGKGKERIEQYYEELEPQTTAAQTWNSGLPVAYHNSTWVGDRTIDYINKHEDSEKPFFMWASFPDPHHPFDCPAPWCYLHRPEDVDLPEHRTRDFENRPWWHKAAAENKPTGGSEQSNKVRREYSRIQPQTDEQLREIIANTYGQISLIDHNVGRILIALEQAGLDENTIVIYTSDHGDWLGDHGLVLKGPMFYEGVSRVGFIVKGPNVPKDHKVDDVISLLDLPATFLDYADAEPTEPMQAKSMKALFEGKEKPEDYPDFAFAEWEIFPYRVGVRLSLRMVRTKTHKLTVELESGAGEMYDLVNDPNEMVNLWDNPDYATVQADLVEKLESRPKDTVEIHDPALASVI